MPFVTYREQRYVGIYFGLGADRVALISKADTGRYILTHENDKDGSS